MSRVSGGQVMTDEPTRQPSAGGPLCNVCGRVMENNICYHEYGSAGEGGGGTATRRAETATEAARRAAEEEALVEAMARAMFTAVNPCVAPHYPSPDEPSLISAPDCVRGTRTGKAWEHFALSARAQLKAHQAMEAFRSGKAIQL